MASIALVGVDGAGKTTVARELLRSARLPMKYVYMGFSTRSSNFALPTSRLVLVLKRHLYFRRERAAGRVRTKDVPAAALEYENPKYGLVWSGGRFLNRLAEAWYRHTVSLVYQLRGYMVVYDRHFLFDS